MRIHDATWFFAVLLALSWFMSPTSALYACTTPVPTSWFAETISLDQTALPAGVASRITNSPSPEQGSATIQLLNTSATPLYILTQSPVDDQMQIPTAVELPAGMAPTRKLVDGKAYVWKGRNWFQDYNQPFALYIWQNRVNVINGSIADIGWINPYNTVRPTAVAVPQPQHLLIPFIYKDKLLHLPITINYTLNTAYDPGRISNGVSCNQTVATMTPAIVALNAPSPQSSVPLLFGTVCVGILVAMLGAYLMRKADDN